MNDDREQELIRKYPKIFDEQVKTWGITCGDGWYNILDALCSTLVLLNENGLASDSDIRAVQVKEKFGGLRFYTASSNEKVWAARHLAEYLSFTTCETCGAPGVRRDLDFWIYVACDAHARP